MQEIELWGCRRRVLVFHGRNILLHPGNIRYILQSKNAGLLISKGKALECNTAGFKYGLGHLHPYEEILKRYRELGGELLTVGSDGHRPNEVGGYFEQAAEILKSCGFRYYTVYRERNPVFLEL